MLNVRQTLFRLIDQWGVTPLFAVVVDHGVAGNGVQQSGACTSFTILFQTPRKTFLQNVAGKVIIPRAPDQVSKKPIPVLLVECSEISHVYNKTDERLKGYTQYTMVHLLCSGKQVSG
jgi:hypothetical protein